MFSLNTDSGFFMTAIRLSLYQEILAMAINPQAADISQHPDALLTTAQAAQFLNYKKHTLEVWRLKGHGPQYVQVNNRTIRYRLIDLLRWAESRLVPS